MSITINQACENIESAALNYLKQAFDYADLAERSRCGANAAADDLSFAEFVFKFATPFLPHGTDLVAFYRAQANYEGAKSAEFWKQFIMFDQMHHRCLSSIQTGDVAGQQAFIYFAQLTDPYFILDSLRDGLQSLFYS